MIGIFIDSDRYKMLAECVQDGITATFSDMTPEEMERHMIDPSQGIPVKAVFTGVNPPFHVSRRRRYTIFVKDGETVTIYYLNETKESLLDDSGIDIEKYLRPIVRFVKFLLG